MREQNWAVVIPYFNEEDCLEQCMSCLLHQTKRPSQIILVNNASTDRSPLLTREFKEQFGHLFEIVLIDEPKPGKIHALVTGTALVRTDYFATWDADTYYPPDYLTKAHTGYQGRKGSCVAAVMATNIKGPLSSFKSLFRIFKIQTLATLFSSECHAGGYAETFRTALFRKVGGFDPVRWPYVLEDHEIVECLLKVGRVRYPIGFWCLTSPRRADRCRVTWTKTDKILYRYTPFFMKKWFFYTYLWSRFEQKGLFFHRLREQPWKTNKKSS